MGSIDALERLRDELTKRGESDEMMGLYLHDHEVAMQLIAAVYCEVDERFMALPLDADGVPIRVGDKLECHANGKDGIFIVFAIGDKVAVENTDDSLTRVMHVARFCHHFKPRTLEDVLCDFANDVAKQGHQIGLTGREISDKYAAEIRELLGVDA